MIQARFIIMLCTLLLAAPQLVFASKTHVVRKSESIKVIASKYKVSVEELKAVNNLSGTHVDKGTRVIIPSHPEKKQKMVQKPRNYKVSKGDSLPKIARKTGVKVADIKRFNGITGNKIMPGQILALADIAVLEETSQATASDNRLQLVNKELLSEQEFSDTLAELTDIISDRPVDLAKNLEENNTRISKIKKIAYSFLGARYRFGGTSRNSLDCSSFTQQVFREQNVSIPRTAREQFYAGSEVMMGDLQKGDLVFFQTYARFPSHVGIYLGNRKMIHASSRDRRVVISSMDTPYYLSRFLGARRVGKDIPDASRFEELLQGVEEEQDGDVINNDMMGITVSMNK